MSALTKPQLMGHIIAGYPSFDFSLYAALGICQAGASYLEVQFPFSDPNADGIVIEEACNKSIAQGFKVSQGFALLHTLSQHINKDNKQPTRLIIMTYANLIFRYGVEAFIKEAKKSGVWGIIAPDLPIESDESLRKLAKKHHICIISLIAPKASLPRIKKIAQISDEIVYVVARAGITGEKTHIDNTLFDWIHCINKHCKKPIALGFGINSYEQVSALKDKVDIIVAGSYFVRYISELSTQQFSPQDYTHKLEKHTQMLMGWNKET
ncbi:tryptophan synthase subunit alpha [Helicobacter sp. MIT 21-1697]|uniref:tryptophan synthase subunit alpha n=1 Tax=Helicobacter sp. MIT 21-1697 TaxID=2993733 RepID=UPI00224B6D6B|nr:tryptophan synthase subunit alpha [Helicobacter sp. MIT 21-1697]MCX2717419.1 tryptophan synthase subunit alpha [Helicobacter sp. MIT 21-1697]